MSVEMPDDRVHVHKLHAAGFRSIERLTVDFAQTTLLVGPNGAGKSNIIDALVFMSDAVTQGLRAAVGSRDGMAAVRRRAIGTGRHPDIRLEVEFSAPTSVVLRQSDGRTARVQRQARRRSYGFVLGTTAGADWYVKEEWLARKGRLLFYQKEGEVLRYHRKSTPPTDPGRLALPMLADSASRQTQTALEGITKYSINPEVLQAPQPFSAATALEPSGSNLNYVWKHLRDAHPNTAARILELLRQVLPGIVDLECREVGRYATLEATFDTRGKRIKIDGAGLSDGTLRALALLVALYQPEGHDVVAVEEPEIALHPYAAGLLFDALLSSPLDRQLIASTHSPAVLETPGVDIGSVRVVEWTDGATVAGPVAPDLLEDVRGRLATGAELLADGALRPKLLKQYRSIRPRR